MIKRIMTITLVIALVLSQSSIAGAFVSRGTAGPETATIDLLTGRTEDATLSVAIKKVVGDTVSAEIGWDGLLITMGTTGWLKSTEYLEVTYAANVVGWGIQIYTDNMAVAANPKYEGDPTSNPAQQPSGLIGTSNKDLTCPLAIMVNDELIPNAKIVNPVETSSGTPGDANYVKFFTTGYDALPGGDHEKVWFWLKDKSGTFWDDKNSDGILDLTGSFGDAAYELVTGFSTTGDDYATILSTFGASSGWVSATTGLMQRNAGPTTPVYTYFAADFTNATELQHYTTNTIELEIYND